MEFVEITNRADIDVTLMQFGVPRDQWERVHTLRFAQDGGGVKFKINEGMWSPSLGYVVN